MFRFLYIILLSLFFTSCSVKSNLIQDEFTNIKKSLDDEINKRVKEYKNDNTKTSPFGTGLVKIREKLVSKLWF